MKMPPTTLRTPRPELLSAGLILSAVHAALAAALSLLAGVLALGVSVTALDGALGPVPATVMSLGALFVVGMVCFYGLVILVCWRAWHGSRAWLWGAVFLSAIGLVNTGPISAVISVLTIIGALQWLERMPRHSEVAA